MSFQNSHTSPSFKKYCILKIHDKNDLQNTLFIS